MAQRKNRGFLWSLVEEENRFPSMAAAEESITNYFSYVKNVLGVKTIQSARIRQSLQAEIQVDVKADIPTDILTDNCDLLFLNLKQASAQSIFAPECAELLDKMIQAMRLGNRRHLILEYDLTGNTKSTPQILQLYTQKVTTTFVVLFSTKPTQNRIQNLGIFKFLESYSPSYLLQNPQAKKMAWTDLQKVMKEIGVS